MQRVTAVCVPGAGEERREVSISTLLTCLWTLCWHRLRPEASHSRMHLAMNMHRDCHCNPLVQAPTTGASQNSWWNGPQAGQVGRAQEAEHTPHHAHTRRLCPCPYPSPYASGLHIADDLTSLETQLRHKNAKEPQVFKFEND